MEWIFEQVLLHPRRSGVVFLLALLVCCTSGWWFLVWQNPHVVFDDMLGSNLTSSSVTKEVYANGNGQSIDQIVRLSMGGKNVSDWLVMARQQGSEVYTESIGTLEAGYIRYVRIATAQMPVNSKSYDFNHVINVWAKSDSQADNSLQNLFSNSLLDITNAPTPPIAMLTSDERNSLLEYMHDQKVFTPDYGKVKSERVDGRLVYSYDVSVIMPGYVRAMQAFAQDVGLTGLKNVDPNQYSTLKPLHVAMSVDKTTHRLVRLSFGNKNSFVQHYTDWGLAVQIAIPQHTISTTELQNRLQLLSALPS